MCCSGSAVARGKRELTMILGKVGSFLHALHWLGLRSHSLQMGRMHFLHARSATRGVWRVSGLWPPAQLPHRMPVDTAGWPRRPGCGMVVAALAAWTDSAPGWARLGVWVGGEAAVGLEPIIIR